MPIIQTDKEMRPRDARDFYPTPEGLVLAILHAIAPWVSLNERSPRILDVGAGHGIWGKIVRKLWPHAHIAGVDNHFHHPRVSGVYDVWFVCDFLEFNWEGYDIIIGNPPYKYAEEFVRHAHKFCDSVIYLLRLAFLESQTRLYGLWQEIIPIIVWVLGRRPSFTGDGKTDATAYAVYWWNKRVFDFIKNAPLLRWMEWDYLEGELDGD